MPGMEYFAPERTLTSNGPPESPHRLPTSSSKPRRAMVTCTRSWSGCSRCARSCRQASVVIVNQGGTGRPTGSSPPGSPLSTRQVLLVHVTLTEAVHQRDHGDVLPRLFVVRPVLDGWTPAMTKRGLLRTGPPPRRHEGCWTGPSMVRGPSCLPATRSQEAIPRSAAWCRFLPSELVSGCGSRR